MSALRLATQDGAPVPTGADLHDHFHSPAGESKEDRERRLARDRKRAQRAREAQAKLKAEAVKVPLELYQGTVKALQAVIEAGGFDGPRRPRRPLPCCCMVPPLWQRVTVTLSRN